MPNSKHHQLARVLASNGRGGDDMIAHIQASDIPVLLAAGKAGTVNPRDHLLEFYPAGAMGGGSDPGGDRGGYAGRSGGGMGNGDPGKGGSPSNDAGFSNGHTYSGGTTVGGMPNPDPYGLKSPTAQALTRQGMPNVPAAMESQHNYVRASQAYANRTGLQKLGDILAGMFPGVSTAAPALANPSTYAGGTYHQSFNPAGAIGAVLGAASGAMGASTLGEQAFGRVYNALGGNNYSFGGGGVDPQTGESTSGWGPSGTGFGFGGGTSHSSGAPGNPGSNQGGKGPSIGTGASSPAAVGTGAQASHPTDALGVPAIQAPYVGTATPLNTYQGTPWPTYPDNVWIGGGSGSRVYG